MKSETFWVEGRACPAWKPILQDPWHVGRAVPAGEAGGGEGRPGLDDALGVGLCSVDRGTCQHGTSSVQWERPALGRGDATRDKGLGRARWAPCTGGGCALREWREREFEVLEETQTSLKLSSGLC